ncbi:secretion system protein [Bordetella pertussis]|nr:secretion system protein [Bordetella pertussis]CPO56415.1 secretion system protein [Bordetella pertussis]CRE33288.1 secretion system protein [Bordetella pertussis]CRE33667.1 secretion system protein [Bordetella pertussis]
MALQRLTLMCMQHPNCQMLPYSTLRALVESVIDIVVVVERRAGQGARRRVVDIWYRDGLPAP